jgi:DNA-binding Lrp family transcriptional regulator
VKKMKNTEWKLVSELMKNSRRSDRELAKAVGVSQPTASRLIKQLEKEGTIQEYTMIPNFAKLGYKILALTIVKLKQSLSPEQIDQARKVIGDALKVMTIDVLMLERGLGLDSDGVIISCHKDYSSYVEFNELLKKGGGEFLLLEDLKSFLINLQDEVRFIPLTLSIIAHNLSKIDEKKK